LPWWRRRRARRYALQNPKDTADQAVQSKWH
jgi:hypothetical protein